MKWLLLLNGPLDGYFCPEDDLGEKEAAFLSGYGGTDEGGYEYDPANPKTILGKPRNVTTYIWKPKT